MIRADGYIKVLNRESWEKRYKAWLVMPDGVDRLARRSWRTAVQADEYGQALAARYNRRFAQLKDEQTCAA